MREEKYLSWMYIDGKRLNNMKSIAQGFFSESFIDVYINKEKRIFVIRVQDDVPAKQLKIFQDKYKLCEIVPFKRLNLKDICKECK